MEARELGGKGGGRWSKGDGMGAGGKGGVMRGDSKGKGPCRLACVVINRLPSRQAGVKTQSVQP